MCIVAETVVDGMDLSMTHQSIMVLLDGKQESKGEVEWSFTSVLNPLSVECRVSSVECRVSCLLHPSTPGGGHDYTWPGSLIPAF